MQCLTVFKSFRLSGVPERIAHCVYQYLTEGGSTIELNDLDSFKLLLLIVVEIC